MMWSSYELLAVFWRASWQAVVLAAVIYALCRIFHRTIPASAKTLLWTLPILRLLLLVVPASNFSIFNATSMVGRERALSQISNAESHSEVNERSVNTHEDLLESKANVVSRLLVSPEIGGPQHNEIGPSLDETAAVQVSKSSIFDPGNFYTLIALPESIVAVWIFGMGYCLIRYILAQLVLSRVIRNGRSIALKSLLPSHFWSEFYKKTTEGFLGRALSRVRVIAVDDQFGPAVTGIFRPVVLLPQKMLNQYSQDELTMVITHELEHIRRFDTTLLFIAQLATMIHWFNPLSFWLKKRLQAEVEIAVDATTVRKLGLDKVKHYAELLFKVSSANNSPAYILSMARRSSSFRQRIEQLTEIEPDSRFRASIGTMAILALILTGLSDAVSQERTTTTPTTSVSSNLQVRAPYPSAATSDAPKAETARLDQPQPQQSQEDSSETDSEPKFDETTNSPAQSEFRSVSGQVVDAQRNGVPNAKLFYEYDKSTTQVTTDNAGNFTIALPRKPHPFDSFHTWVYADGFGLRVVAIKCVLNDDEDMTGVTIPLPPLERNATSIEVLDPEGQPVSGALIMPSKVELPNGLFLADKSTGLISAIPEQLFESLAVRTDKNGKASFDRFPNALWSGVRCQCDQFGIQLFEFRRGIGNAKIELRKVGSVHGKIASYEPSKFPSLGFTIETKSQNGTTEVKGFASGKLNEKGEFMIPAIADGAIYSFRIGNHVTDAAQDCELICRDYKLEKVLPGKTLELVLTSPPTVSVSGVVLTSDTRVPVSGAVIVSYRRDSPHVRSYTTNQNGEFEIRVVPGQVGLQMISLSDSPEISKRYGYTTLPDVVTEETRLEVLLPVRKSIKGELRDETGTPVANQRIRKFRGGVTHRNTAGEALTDSEGKFEMFLWDNSIESNVSWATIDLAEYVKHGEIKSVIKQVSVKDDYYVLEQPSRPVAPKN